jgi:hypothetical protein
MNKVISFKWIPLGSVLLTCLFLSVGYIRIQSTLSLPKYTSVFKNKRPSVNQPLTFSSFKASSSSTLNRLHIALTPQTSILGQRIFTLGYEGRYALPITHDLIDQATLAVQDGLVQGALSLSDQPRSNDQSLTLGSTSVEWVSRGEDSVLSTQTLNMILATDKPTWPNGRPFQLALRASPSLLEKTWFTHHPDFEKQIKRSIIYQKSPRFYSEDTLIQFLKNTPGAIALMEKARTRLLGIPVRSIQIEETKPVRIYLTFHHLLLSSINTQITQYTQSQLLFWLDFLKGDDLKSGLNEWGWDSDL